MGWSAGSEIMDSVILTVKKNVSSRVSRALIYRDIIPAFLDNDADNLHECIGHDEVYDIVIKELDPADWEDMEEA